MAFTRVLRTESGPHACTRHFINGAVSPAPLFMVLVLYGSWPNVPNQTVWKMISSRRSAGQSLRDPPGAGPRRSCVHHLQCWFVLAGVYSLLARDRSVLTDKGLITVLAVLQGSQDVPWQVQDRQGPCPGGRELESRDRQAVVIWGTAPVRTSLRVRTHRVLWAKRGEEASYGGAHL